MNLKNTLTTHSLNNNLHSYFGYPKIACVDLETTGLSPYIDRIIEIGIVLIEAGRVTEYQWFVNPDQTVSPFIYSFTGIMKDDLDEAHTFREIANQVYDVLDNALFVAHNAAFDSSFLYHSFNRTQIHFNPTTLCTVHLARRVIPGLRSYNLDSVLSGFEIPSHDRHRALPDAQAVFEILQKVKNL